MCFNLINTLFRVLLGVFGGVFFEDILGSVWGGVQAFLWCVAGIYGVRTN